MTRFYYYVVLFNAIVCVAVAISGFWKNRYRAFGPLFGAAMLVMAIWLTGFAHYFKPMPEREALLWAKVTLSTGILSAVLYFHSICALLDKMRRLRWWIGLGYGLGFTFVVLIWLGWVIHGLKVSPYMDHYVQYNRDLYPLLGTQISGWQWFGFAMLVYHARLAKGYRRTQLMYFIVTWSVVFLTANLIILPIEYGFSIQPYGFLVLPLNFAALAYVMAKARLADFNVAVARVLLHGVTLVIVVATSLVFIGVLTLVKPDFLNQMQIAFIVGLVIVIGLGLTASLPRLLPRAERMMQERMFGKRYGYQDALASLVKELSRMPTIDQVLESVASTLHSQMQVSRVLIFMQDPLAGTYKIEAESGLNAQELSGLGELREDLPVVRYLLDGKDVLVRDELPRRVSAQVMQELSVDLDRLNVSVCAPMILDERLVGILCVGEKINKAMFFIGDLRLLENLATEVALAVKYRRMEDQVFRKNKLIELGTIAAGVAHEIRNPLASIRTFAQLMPERMEDPEFKNEFSKLVMKDVDRITKVVESMLAFARPAQVQIAEHSASDLVEEAVLLVQARLKSKRIEVTKQFHETPVLRVDKQQILQVLVNLLSNASDALPELGKIRVVTGVRAMDDVQEGNGNLRYGVIEVADNGPGIPPAVRNRLFDPFFTTKKEGTGLGLSISQKIVRDHGGIITVSSVEGKGTTFQVNLPLN